jgi:2-polyprenyl-3-methyl-5-hydroxy-6-metoxy-1,4-benzoquinol methylase
VVNHGSAFKRLDSSMRCRICASANIHELGSVEFYIGYPCTIWECSDCRCRFTGYDPEVYNLLHSDERSRYDLYWELARKCESLFARHDLAGIRKVLSATPKYRFVIDEIEARPGAKKLLEVGCSRGYLTSFFILAGYEVYGVDLSSEAVRAAREAFGDHFFLANSERIQENKPYDVIYHVGTIGCVEDPVGYTQRMLHMLKPGGLLLFNAPNADACCLAGQLWTDGAPPPDLVTLFRKGFWTDRFASVASVQEVVEYCEPEQAFRIFTWKLRRMRWQRPQPLCLTGSRGSASARQGTDDGRSQLIARGRRLIHRIAALSGVTRLVPPQPTEFGLFVKMTKK